MEKLKAGRKPSQWSMSASAVCLVCTTLSALPPVTGVVFGWNRLNRRRVGHCFLLLPNKVTKWQSFFSLSLFNPWSHPFTLSPQHKSSFHQLYRASEWEQLKTVLFTVYFSAYMLSGFPGISTLRHSHRTYVLVSSLPLLVVLYKLNLPFWCIKL